MKKISLTVAIVVLSIAVCVLACKTSRLNNDLTQRDAQIENMSAENASLEKQLKNAESGYQTYKDRFSNERMLYSDLRAKYKNLDSKYTFFYLHSVIKPDDDTVYLHRYGCDHLTTNQGFWIYDTETAFHMGYHPCEYCMKDGFYIGNRDSRIYHKPTCGSLPAFGNREYFLTFIDAKSAGCRPCSLCNPL